MGRPQAQASAVGAVGRQAGAQKGLGMGCTALPKAGAEPDTLALVSRRPSPQAWPGPARGGPVSVLQQQLPASEPQAVLTQARPVLLGLQLQRGGGAGSAASCTGGRWQKGRGLGQAGSPQL